MPISRLPYVFVGRSEELALFQALLAAESPGAIMYICAPAGMGKSRLLDAFERTAVAADAHTTRMSALDLPPVPRRIRDVTRTALYPDARRQVLLLDDFHAHARLERWYGTELLPALSAQALVVVAGRARLERKLIERMRRERTFEERILPPLHATAAEEMLRSRGVEDSRVAELVDLAGGIPLMLEELASIHRERGPRAHGMRPRQEALSALFKRIHADIPTDDHRRALWATALASPLSPRLLAATVDSVDTRAHYRWLARQSFIDASRESLAAQPVYRDAVMLDLLRSAPTQYRTMLWRAGQFLLAQFNAQKTFEKRRDTIAALLHLQRAPGGATSDASYGRAAVRAISGEHEARAALRALKSTGGAPQPIMEALLSQPSECVILERGDHRIAGIMHFASSTGRRQSRDRARQALDHVDRLACVDRPGRRRKIRGPRALVCSAWLAEPADPQGPACDAGLNVLLERTLAPPDLRIMALRADLTHPALVERAQRAGLFTAPPAPDPLDPSPQRHPSWLLLRDNDREPPGKWLRMQLGRSISGQEDDPMHNWPRDASSGELSRRDFSDAVRHALPHFGNPAELVHSPLATIAGTERGGAASGIRLFIVRGLELMAQNRQSRGDAHRLRRHYGIGEPGTLAEEPGYDSPGEVRAAEDRLVSALWQEHVQRLRARSSA